MNKLKEEVNNFLNRGIIKESNNEVTKNSSRYGKITILSTLVDKIEIGDIDFKKVEKILDKYIKPKNNGVYEDVNIFVGFDRKTKVNGVTRIQGNIKNMTYKDIASISNVSESAVKDSGYPDANFGLWVSASPYMSDPDNKPNAFKIVGKDRRTDVTYASVYAPYNLNDTQKIIKSNIFTRFRKAAYELTDVIYDAIN